MEDRGRYRIERHGPDGVSFWRGGRVWSAVEDEAISFGNIEVALLAEHMMNALSDDSAIVYLARWFEVTE